MQTEIKRKLEEQYSYQTKQTLSKDDYKRQRRGLHNDHSFNPKRRYNNYISTKYRSTSTGKTSTSNHKGRNGQ